MKHLSTYLIILSLCTLSAYSALAQDVLNPSRVLWSAPLSASTVKSLVDAGGNTWTLSSPNTFQVIDPLGKVRWTKTLSTLTVADFAVDQQGQVLLVGLPATGQPILEKYDATQTLAWRNVLDSLSNAAGQATNLSVTANSLGNSVVMGVNALNVRRAICYFAKADGKLTLINSFTINNTSQTTPIRPVLYNNNDMLLGFQTGDVDAPPTFFRVKTDSLPTVQRVADNIYPLSVRYALNNKVYSPALPPTIQRSLPLFSDGQTAHIILRANYVKRATKVDSAQAGYALYRQQLTTNPSADYFFNQQAQEYGTPDSKAISEAASRYMDARGNLITTQVVSSSATGPAGSLLINEYRTLERSFSAGANKQFLLVSSLKAGTISADGLLDINRLTILKRTADGTLLLAGTTSGTLTVGNRTFTGTQATPTQFLVAISAEPLRQTLSADQINWATALPGTLKKVISNSRKQTWVQLADSTFRYYNAQGKIGWEKRGLANTVYDAKADDKGNLYVMAKDSINVYDSTGTLQRRFLYQQGERGYTYQLYIKPDGSGLALWFVYGYPPAFTYSRFDSTGKLAPAGYVFNTYLARVSLTIKPLPLPNQQTLLALSAYTEPNRGSNYMYYVGIDDRKGGYFTASIGEFNLGSYPVDDSYSSADNGLTTFTRGFLKWSGFDGSNTYISSTQSYSGYEKYFYGYGLTKVDSSGKSVINEANTPRANTIGVSFAQAVNRLGSLFTINLRSETAIATSYEVVLNEYSPAFTLRNTTRIGSVTLVNGQPDKTSWELVQAYADGSLLLSGTTSGTLTIGNNTYMGSNATPARFLTLINSVVAQVTGPSTAVCQGSNAVLKSRYKGYLAQAPIIQLSNAQGSFAQPMSLQVPLSQSALVDTTLSAVSLPIPVTLAAGTYRVRTLVGTLVSEWASLSVTATPAAPTASQQGDELTSSASSGSYQWYDAENKPIAGATDARYKPQTSGSYYIVNTANGCASLPSNRLAYLILATEPVATVEVYPNPAADQLFVRWPGAGSMARIKLLNAQGRVVQDVPRRGEVTNVPTPGLASGLVLVQLQDEGKPTLVRKVLIQR